MGLTGGLVRRVFSKSRSSTDMNDGNERNFGVEKSRWSSLRMYLCGDELNSPMENDFTSIRDSYATVMQPIAERVGEETYPVTKSKELRESSTTQQEENERNSPMKSIDREDAAIVIQSSFRGFMARQRYKQIGYSAKQDHIVGSVKQSGESEAMSTQVEVGDCEESIVAVQHRMLRKTPSQIYRLKEEWDDSTLSSNISRLRIQSRLEATTRRERALAYAFSQQLRACSRKKSARPESTEPNVGWSWLERWMAARMPEDSSTADCSSNRFEPARSAIVGRRFEVSMEEKESCGSNDISMVAFDGFAEAHQAPKEGYGPVKNRLKDSRAVSRRKTAPDYHHTPLSTKVVNKSKQVEPKSIGERECSDTTQPPSDY